MSTRKTTLFYGALIAVSSLAVGMVIASRLDLTPASSAQSTFTPPSQNSAPITGSIDAQTFRNIAKAQQPVVVNIRTESKQRGQDLSDFFGGGSPDDFFRRFFNQPGDRDRDDQDNNQQGQGRRAPRRRDQTTVAAGTGFIISKDGLILTNNHVIDGATKIEVSLFGEEDDHTYGAKLIGRDGLTDSALIQLTEKPNHALQEAKFGDSSQMAAGDWVVAIGNPFGQGWTVTVGVISAVQRPFLSEGRTNEMIQTDAAINPGNSGGPLVNANAEVVGINSAGVQGANNIGFAIDINSVKDVIEQLKQGKSVAASGPFVGVATTSVSDLDDQARQQYDVQVDQGAVITQVVSGSAADKAGVQEGDVVVKADGKPVTSSDDLRSAIQAKKPGDKLTLTVNRGSTESTIDVTVGSRSVQNS